MRVSRSRFDGSPNYCRLVLQSVFSPILQRVMGELGMQLQQKYLFAADFAAVAAAAHGLVVGFVLFGYYCCENFAWNWNLFEVKSYYYFLLLRELLQKILWSRYYCDCG